MKIAFLSSASAGGAGIAAYRIYQAFNENSDHDVEFFDINTFMETVNLSVSPQSSFTNKKYSNTHFTVDYGSKTRQWVVDLLSKFDIVNIHWASYLISLSEILALAKTGTTILFTLHDYYYMTGGCHYPAGCTGFLQKCVACPQLDTSLVSYEVVKSNQAIKKEIFSYQNVLLSAPSEFIVRNAVDAKIVDYDRAYVLRNAYSPIESMIDKDHSSRNMLLIADSFNEKRKGLQLAVESLKLASVDFAKQTNPLPFNLHLVGGVDQEVVQQLNDYPINVITHGHVKDHEVLVNIFQKCHFILSCSFEDNWPNILVESGAYGCIPIVGKWHGCEEFVESSMCGFVANEYTASSFGEIISIALCVDDRILTDQVSKIANFVRAEHSYELVVSCYEKAITNSNEYIYPVSKEKVSINYVLKEKQKDCGVVASPFGLQSKLLEDYVESYGIQVLERKP